MLHSQLRLTPFVNLVTHHCIQLGQFSSQVETVFDKRFKTGDGFLKTVTCGIDLRQQKGCRLTFLMGMQCFFQVMAQQLSLCGIQVAVLTSSPCGSDRG